MAIVDIPESRVLTGKRNEEIFWGAGNTVSWNDGSMRVYIYMNASGCTVKIVDFIHSIVYSVQFSSVAQSCLTLHDPMDHSMPGLPVHHQLLVKLISMELVIPCNHLILCHPLLLPPSIFPSIRPFLMSQFFASGGQSIGSLSFNINPSNEYSGLNSFRMDWLDRLAVQGTLKSLLQHHSSKAAILWHSAFFMVQLSQPYMTTGVKPNGK